MLCLTVVPGEDGRTSVLQSQNNDTHALEWVTPPIWTDQATADLSALLDDHAHLERKAASNALELLHRCPSHGDDALAQQWTLVLTGVARDEIEHLGAVTRILAQRGGRLSRMHRNPYASALRRLVRKGTRGELVDRLIVCALIELRSFERFEMLAMAISDDLLTRLYRRLAISERGHHAVFLELACHVTPAAEVTDRWAEMLAAEAKIISTQPPGPRMHSGVS